MVTFTFPSLLGLPNSGAVPAPLSSNITAASAYAGIGFIAQAATVVKKVALRFGTITGTDNVTVSVQTTNSNGSPSGTSVVSQTIAANTLTANAWNEITFTTTGTLTKGTRYVIDVLAASTFTSTVELIQGYSNYSDASYLPYSYSGTSTTYTPSTLRFSECFAIIDNAGLPNVYGGLTSAETGQAIQATSAVSEIGNKFKVASSLCSTYRVLGLRVSADSTTQTTPNLSWSIYAWNSGNNSTALCQDSMSPYTNNITGRASGDFYFSNPATLNAGTEYIACIGTTGTTGTLNILTVSVQTDTPDNYKPLLWDQTSDYLFDRVSRTSLTGSWTTTANSIASMQLIIEIVTFPPSGSGGGYSANFNQGFGQ